MITVSIARLMELLDRAPAFSIPGMNTGTEYLYSNLYSRLASGDDVLLSGIDFNAFSLDDIDSIREIYGNVLETQGHHADIISRSLRGLSPVTAPPSFV